MLYFDKCFSIGICCRAHLYKSGPTEFVKNYGTVLKLKARARVRPQNSARLWRCSPAYVILLLYWIYFVCMCFVATLTALRNIELTFRVKFCLTILHIVTNFKIKLVYLQVNIFYVIHNNNKTHNIKWYNLMVLGYMFRPHCGHLQASLYRSSALNVRTIWDPIVCKIMMVIVSNSY
jgi:hypothetical protein